MQRLFNILILFLTLILTVNTCFAKNIKFIQITDLHLTSDEEALNNYKKAIEKINSEKDIDFVVFTGDNINKTNPEYLENFVKLTKTLKVPYYIEIGNRDCLKTGKLSKMEYLSILNKGKIKKLHSFNYAVKKGKFLYVFVDGTKEKIPSQNGYYNENTIKWLDKILSKNKNKTVIIFQHYPIIEYHPNSTKNLYKSELYTDMLKKHDNVIAIFAGHYHTNMEYKFDDSKIIHIVTPPAKLGDSKYREIYVIDNDNKQYEIYSQVIGF